MIRIYRSSIAMSRSFHSFTAGRKHQYITIDDLDAALKRMGLWTHRDATHARNNGSKCWGPNQNWLWIHATSSNTHSHRPLHFFHVWSERGTHVKDIHAHIGEIVGKWNGIRRCIQDRHVLHRALGREGEQLGKNKPLFSTSTSPGHFDNFSDAETGRFRARLSERAAFLYGYLSYCRRFEFFQGEVSASAVVRSSSSDRASKPMQVVGTTWTGTLKLGGWIVDKFLGAEATPEVFAAKREDKLTAVCIIFL